MSLTKAQIAHMTARFLLWPLPLDFKPDGGIQFEEPFGRPTGTNLLTAAQASEMLKWCAAGLPDLSDETLNALYQAKHEIETLRSRISALEPKAHAYDTISIMLRSNENRNGEGWAAASGESSLFSELANNLAKGAKERLEQILASAVSGTGEAPKPERNEDERQDQSPG